MNKLINSYYFYGKFIGIYKIASPNCTTTTKTVLPIHSLQWKRNFSVAYSFLQMHLNNVDPLSQAVEQRYFYQNISLLRFCKLLTDFKGRTATLTDKSVRKLNTMNLHINTWNTKILFIPTFLKYFLVPKNSKMLFL